MHENTEFSLSRDVDAIEIPSGRKFTLEKGTQGVITQTLGGSYTVATPSGLSRIAEKDLDALGLEKPEGQSKEKSAGTNGEVSEEDVWNQLRQCYDPEIPVNIVDLGLVYECTVKAGANGKRDIDVAMTLTAPGCGMGDVLVQDVREKLAAIPTVGHVEVNLTFDPPWSQSMMSEAARLQTGMTW